MLKRLLILAILAAPLPACQTMQTDTLDNIRMRTKGMCEVAGNVFGWELVETDFSQAELPNEE